MKKSRNQRQFKNTHSTSDEWENVELLKERDRGVRSWFGGDGKLTFEMSTSQIDEFVKQAIARESQSGI